MKQLFTIGYEGSDIGSLIRTLDILEIELLADVRELPLSRKRGFSKNSLAEHLRAVGIDYRHYRQLGDPKAGRDAAKSGDFAKFEEIFSAHMLKDETQKSLAELLLVAREKRTCLLCFERCANHCHRSIIADDAICAGFDVLNLVPDRPEKYLVNDFPIPRHRSRKSLSAAE